MPGARRTDTALARLETTTNAMEAVVFASQSGDYHPNWTSLERQPEVAELAPWDLMFGMSNGQPVILFGSDDGRWLGTVDRAVVALWPARSVVRSRPAVVLRTE